MLAAFPDRDSRQQDGGAYLAAAHGNAAPAAGSLKACRRALDHCKSRPGRLPARGPRLLYHLSLSPKVSLCPAKSFSSLSTVAHRQRWSAPSLGLEPSLQLNSPCLSTPAGLLQRSRRPYLGMLQTAGAIQ